MFDPYRTELMLTPPPIRTPSASTPQVVADPGATSRNPLWAVLYGDLSLLNRMSRYGRKSTGVAPKSGARDSWRPPGLVVDATCVTGDDLDAMNSWTRTRHGAACGPDDGR